MSTLDQRLNAATDDLHAELADLPTPPFKPNRSTIPVLALVVLLLGIGIAGYVARSASDDAGAVSVATQPESPDSIEDITTGPVPADSGETVDDGGSDASPDSDPGGPQPDVPGADAGEATPTARWRTLTNPGPGEFFVPLPLASAWSPDEAKVIIYRTGAADPGHLVFDTFKYDADPILLPFTPPDIEQIYWHPLTEGQLLYASGPELMVFDLETMRSTVEHRFEKCDSVDSGVLPVGPANDGTVSMLCRSRAGVTQVSYNLKTGQELRVETQSDTAASPSPSGNLFVRRNDDGSASVLDRSFVETGVDLDLGGNQFGFVVADGREWIAASLFDGAAIGSIVLLPLDGSDAVVLVGPERGDPYPPSGTSIATAGDKIVISIVGSDDGLTGRITLLDLGASFIDPPRRSQPHETLDLHGYWSRPFVSVSPSGVLVYSTDGGGDRVTTWVGNFIGEVPPAD